MTPDELFELEMFRLGEKIHANAVDKGFYPPDGQRNDYEMLALVHSEISEIVEALRKGNPRSEKCPQLSLAEEEAADVVIRLLDQCHKNKWNLGLAIKLKMEYNKTRPWKHGKLV